MRVIVGAVAACLACGPINAAEVKFCWQGVAGYSVTGRMRFPDQLAKAERITETDVTGFEITGFRDGQVIGQWSLDQLGPATSWNLNFMPRQMMFAVGGDSYTDTGQQWNSNGSADDCGAGGFGFNIGGNAQDICLSNVWIAEAGIAFDTPLAAVPADQPLDCGQDMVISALDAWVIRRP